MKTDSSAVMSHGREVKGQVYWPRIEEEEREAEKPRQLKQNFRFKNVSGWSKPLCAAI